MVSGARIGARPSDESFKLTWALQELAALALGGPQMNVEEEFVRQAIALARLARLAGNHPFGALLVVDGAVALTAQNTVATDRDPTAHAETNLVTRAIKNLSPDQIRRGVLYTSCEPCAMCVGKMYWAGIRSIAYALPAEELALFAGGDFRSRAPSCSAGRKRP